jgi:uroporphyrinogen-III synthase
MRVLVTRPEPGAARTAARLRALGHDAVVLPLSQTNPLPVDLDAVKFDAVAVTSANALRHAPHALIARLAALPCHAVGKRTAETARAAGFRTVTEGPGDAAGLARLVATELAGRKLAYLCGRMRFPGFEDCLSRADVTVCPIETYDTLAVVYSDEKVRTRLSGGPVDSVLLYSVKAAEAARGILARPALAGLFENARILALSERIGAAFGPAAVMPPRPDEDELLALLRRGAQEGE